MSDNEIQIESHDRQDTAEVINCVDCKQDFDFTFGEKKFFEDKGLFKPRRCKSCREARRQQKEGM